MKKLLLFLLILLVFSILPVFSEANFSDMNYLECISTRNNFVNGTLKDTKQNHKSYYYIDYANKAIYNADKVLLFNSKFTDDKITRSISTDTMYYSVKINRITGAYEFETGMSLLGTLSEIKDVGYCSAFKFKQKF